MDYIVPTVNKYKERLHKQNDIKKILRALQKLNEIDMTLEILQVTGVGKAVNNLKKLDGVGDFAKEIVIKWKKLLDNNKTEPQPTQEDEYDPTGNWEMNMPHNKHKRKHVETKEEYDPTQNWKMEKKGKLKSKEASNHLPSYSPDFSTSHQLTKKRKLVKSYADEVKPVIYKPKVESATSSPDHQSSCDEESARSDNDYVSSRESDMNSNDSEQEEPNSYVPSVMSQTLYSGNNSSDGNYEYSNPVVNHKKAERPIPSRSRDYSPQSDSSKLSATKVPKLKSKPSTSNTSKSSEGSRHTTSSNKKAVKRKSREYESDPVVPVKRKADVKVTGTSKSSKKISSKKKQAVNSGELSFEHALTMVDDSKAVKKKKKTKKNSSALLADKIEKKMSAKPKVELHLPQIQPTYRPLPSHLSRSETKLSNRSGKMTDEMAAELHTQRNTKRMQIYSGQKTSYLTKMTSLYDQCMNVLLNNIDKLDVIGGVPYDIIKPVLERCTVEQLYRLEDLNVYLLDDTDELWKKHAEQDFRSYTPEELESWREMYLRLHDAREAKLARLTHSIQARVDKAKPLEKRTKLAYVGVGQAKAPRNVLRAQMKYGTAGKKPMPYQPSTSNRTDASTSLKQQLTEVRMSVPVGSITADTVDNYRASVPRSKKQAPKIPPMMAKTLKSINKLRYRR